MEEYRKFNKKFVLKKAFTEILIGSVILLLMYFFFKNIMPKVVNIENEAFRIVILIVSIYLLVKKYTTSKHLLVYLNRSDFISELKSQIKRGTLTNKNSTESFYFYFLYYAEKLEAIKVKIDILKSFVPIPVIVMLLGLFLNLDTNNLSNYITSILQNIKNMNLNIKEFMLLTILVLIFYYCFEFLRTWFNYKASLEAYYKFKYEYDMLCQKNKKNEVNEKDKDSDSLSHTWNN